MTKPAKKQSLGRGLSAILGGSPELTINSINDKNADKIVGNIIELELGLIETNRVLRLTKKNLLGLRHQ